MIKFLKNLFSAQPTKKASLPFIHENIDVKNYPLADLLLWQKEDKWSDFVEIVRRAHSNKLITGKSITQSTSIMSSTHSNGWIINCSEYEFSNLDYKHIAFLLYTKVKQIGYTLNLGELRSQERSSNIESIIKYYLKPSLRNRFITEDNLASQLYGNITIVYKTINGNPFQFKFEVHSYQDSKYTEPLDFSELLDRTLTDV